MQTAQKIFHSVHAGKDYPVIAEQMIDGLVERGVALRLDDLYCGAGNDARAEAFQLDCKVLSLSQSARDYDVTAVEWLLNLIWFWQHGFLCRATCGFAAAQGVEHF